MRIAEKYKIQKIEKIAFHPVMVISFIIFSFVIAQFYLKISPVLILAGLIALLFSFIVLVKPEIGLFLFMLLVLTYSHFYIDFPRFGFISIPIVLEGLLVSAVAFKMFVKKEQLIGKEIQIKLLVIYMLIIALSTLFAYSYHQVNIGFFRENVFVPFMIFLLAYLILQNKKNLQHFFLVLLITNILILISSLLFIYGVLTPDAEEVNLGYATRLTSFVEDPNEMAFYLINFLAISFLFYLYFRRKILKIGLITLACMNLIAIPFTLSRGGFIAFIGVLLFLYLKFTRNFRVFIILLLLSVFLYFLLPTELLDRFEEAKNIEKTGRYILSKAAAKITLEYPFLGVGPGNVRKYMLDYSGNYIVAGKPVHNLYLSISAQFGIPALIVFLLLIIIIWKKLIFIEHKCHSKNLEGNFNLTTAIALRAIIVSILLMGLTAHIEHKFLVVLILGATLAFIKIVSEEKKFKSDKAATIIPKH